MQTLNAAQKTQKTAAGRIPVDWEAIDLGDYLKEISVRNSPVDPSLPVLSVTNTQGFVASESYFDRKVYSKDLSNYKIVHKDQFAYNPSRINVGSIAQLKSFEKGCLSPMYVVFEAQKGLDADYLAYWIQSRRFNNLINASTQGTVRDSVNFSALAEFPFALPPVNEQKKMTTILSCVDDLIDKTQSVINQTQRLKKALMQELFTRGLPGRHKKFKKTKIGEIPADWEVIKLKDLLREPIRNGYSPNCPEDLNGHWILGLDAVTFQGFNPKGVKPAPVGDKRIYDFVLQSGDILVSRSNTKERVGLAGVYTGNPDNCSYSDLLMRVRVDVKKILPFWLESILLSGYGRMYFEKVARGTSGTMVKIDRKLLEDFLCPLPDTKEQKTVLILLQDVQQTICQNDFLINQLTEIKSALTQVLLTGEVRVK